jgi:hypothetical protein
VSFLYRLIFLGDTAPDRITEIQQILAQSLQAFELNIDREVELLINPEQITTNNLIATAAIFFGSSNATTKHLSTLLKNNTPILPIVSSLQNVSQELDGTNGQISPEAIENICLKIEKERSKGIAVRRFNLASRLRLDIEKIGGRITGTSTNHITYIQLADGREVVAHPTLGLPNAITLQNAMESVPDRSNVIIFDHVGLEPWLGHIEWLGSQIPAVKWIKSTEIGWRFADWEV